ncbi:MAG: hypothetical protein HZA90_02870 [Verrucomicrobia bacterium]|nr:hypothetical protein [Verrucomicrobiota bacterium]
MKALAERARQLGNTLYPKVCALLADGDTKFPRQFDLQFKKRLPNGNTADSPPNRVRLNATHARMFRDKPGMLDQVLIHEMAHVAQHYEQPIIGRWLVRSHDPPAHWAEGIADYVCFKLGETNGRCAQCDFSYPDFRSGYSCAGAFLLYVERTYNSDLVRQLNTRLRHGGYSDEFFANATGRSLPQLWMEFQQTAAFTPNAARMLALRQALGYVQGKPPEDVEQRFKAFVDQNADALTRELLKAVRVPAAGDLQARLVGFLYLTQPGGAAETFMARLQKAGKLPGFAKGEKGTLSSFLNADALSVSFPVNRSFTATKRGEPSCYHYELARASAEAEWQLQRAWRTNPDGTVAEEYLAR